MICWANGAKLYIKWLRVTMYTPAVTMVAACIRADTGVGPAIASGNQVYNGIWHVKYGSSMFNGDWWIYIHYIAMEILFPTFLGEFGFGNA